MRTWCRGGARQKGGIVSAMAISGIVFGCVFGSVLLGTVLRAVLLGHHLIRPRHGPLRTGDVGSP